MTQPKKKLKPKSSRPTYTARWRFGIMNHLGGIWTVQTFNTELFAQRYLDEQRRIWPGNRLRKHKVIPVRVTVIARSINQKKKR